MYRGSSPTGGRAVCHIPFILFYCLGVYDVLSHYLENEVFHCILQMDDIVKSLVP